MLTQEKMDKLTEYLEQNEDRAAELLNMEAADAEKALGEAGMDITADELREIASSIAKASAAESGELDESALENVAGGLGTTAVLSTEDIQALLKKMRERRFGLIVFPRTW